MPTPSRLDVDYRQRAWQSLAEREFDVLIIGGGVTGAGAALDAATRGLSVAMLEQRDFASGTSSRSSKLFHGGLRYLEQLNFTLVREALKERELMLTRIAPHLVKPVSFLLPLRHRFWERPYVTAGLTLYDSMGGARSVPRHKQLTRTKALQMVPALKNGSLTGGLLYYDAQADDARHTLTVARTAASYGATVLSSARGGQPQARRGAGRRCAGPRCRDRGGGRRQGECGRQLHRRVDRRDPDPRRRPRPVPCAGVQGRAHRRCPRPDQLRDRPDPAHREVGAVRDPVGHPLDHRHHRHRLGARQGAPGGEPHRHRLHPRPHQLGARRAADPPRHPRRVRRAPAAAVRRERPVLAAVPRARRRPAPARPDLHCRREVHHLPGDGCRRHRRGAGRHQ